MEKVILEKETRIEKFLKKVEIIGNKLPHPFMMFLYLIVIISIFSMGLSLLKISAVHPVSKEMIEVRSIISPTGVLWLLSSFLKNLMNFAPFGLVLAMTVGIGFAEETGFVMAFLKKSVSNVPESILPYAIVFIGIVGNLASDAAFVILPPLAALIFMAKGRHPVAGIVASFAGAAGGFSANIMVAGTDALLAGITNEAAKGVTDFIVTPVSNWYFMVISTIFLTLVGGYITKNIVEKRLGKYTGEDINKLDKLTKIEKKGLKFVGITSLVYWGIILVGLFPNGILRDPIANTIIPSPFLKGLIPILFFYFILIGGVYGIVTKSIKGGDDVPKKLNNVIKKMSGFIVLIFVVSQFIAIFNWTNMGKVLAIKGASFLTSTGITGIPLMIGFLILGSFINLFIGSGSAKWALLAPIFIPMFSLMGYSPALIQVAYRVGDSLTNPISPLFTYVPVVLTYTILYKKEAGMGTLISLTLPYTIGFFIFWPLLLIVWMILGLPLGPGGELFL